MKRALIITYYWPPSGGAGVQRWLKFVKYLRNFNWEPVVFTPSNPERPYIDDTLLADIPEGTEVIQFPITEPYQWYRKFTGKKKNEKFQHGFLKENQQESAGIKEKIAIWVRGNLFIPDARLFWVKPSVNFLTKYLAQNPVDIIITTGPPHSVHLIGKSLKKKLSIPWLADFRDPWTGIYYFDKLMLTGLSKKIHRRMEKNVLDTADHLVVVGETMKADFLQLTQTPITTITNGYDHADYNNFTSCKADKFRIVYTGMFLPDQNPPELWEALSELRQTNKPLNDLLEIHLVGKTDRSILKNIQINGLEDVLKVDDYVPHAELFNVQQNAAVLLLCINRIPNASYILTGKVFEYLSTGKPILALCPEESDIASIIKNTRTGMIVPFFQKEQLKENILQLFNAYLNDEELTVPQNTSSYSRWALSQKMAGLMDQLTSTPK